MTLEMKRAYLMNLSAKVVSSCMEDPGIKYLVVTVNLDGLPNFVLCHNDMQRNKAINSPRIITLGYTEIMHLDLDNVSDVYYYIRSCYAMNFQRRSVVI